MSAFPIAQLFEGGSERTLSMDDKASSLAFDTYYRIGRSKKETIKFHISQCVDGDIDKKTCVKLAYNSCNIACLAIDIVRGRLGSNMLRNLAQPKVISQIENLAQLLRDEPPTMKVPWADASRKHLPVMLRTMNGFAVSPVYFEANVGLSLGGQPCWANVVMRCNGHKWACSHCDFW